MQLFVFLMAVIVCAYGAAVDLETGRKYVVQNFNQETVVKRFLIDTDFHNLPVYHVGSSPCEPVSSSCDAQYATAFRHNGETYAYCCSENHKPHVTIHPDGIECDC